MTETLLVTPPLSAEDRMGGLAAGGAVMPGLGLLYIAAMMRQAGLPVEILDAEGLGLGHEGTVQRIVSGNPQILGITSTTLSIVSALRVAGEVKSRLPGIHIFLGGPHVTAMPTETLKSEPFIDGCVLGDGEESFTKIVRNIRNGLEIDRDVHGMAWRDSDRIRMRPKHGHLKDLDRLPFPAWDMLIGFPRIYRAPFHSYRRLPVANIITTRGCPHVCSFCDRSVFGDRVYSHSVEYIIEMIEYLMKDFGIAEISIKDDMFILSPERVSEFCRKIRDRNLNITWSCNARVNSVNRDMLREMKGAGCWMISYGIESGSQKMLKKMMKGITKKQVGDALRETRTAGIVSKGFFMIGIPGETTDTLEETLRFVGELPLDELNVNFFTPFPGSMLYREVLSEGFAPDFGRMNMLEPVYVPRSLAEQELRKYQKRVIRSFYLKPSRMVFYGRRALKDAREFKRVFRVGKMLVSMAYGGLRSG